MSILARTLAFCVLLAASTSLAACGSSDPADGAAATGAGPREQGAVADAADPWEQRIELAFADRPCPEMPPPLLDERHYKGPLIDTHFHMPSIPDANPEGSDDYLQEEVVTSLGVNVTVGEIACSLRHDGTSGRVLAFFPVYPNIEWQAMKTAKRAIDQYPDVFVPFINPPDRDDRPDGFPTVDAATLDRMVSTHPGLFQGWGETGLYGDPGGTPPLPPDSNRLVEIYPVIREHGLVVYFHLGEGQADSFERVLAANRDINFVWHGDQLVTYGEGGAQDLSLIEQLLSRNPNVYYGVDELYGDVWLLRPEVGREKFLAHFRDYEPLLEKDAATWKGFIERHPDQVLWGTDRGVYLFSLDIEVGRTLSNYARAFIALLDPAVQEKFAYRNAEALFGPR